MLLQGCYETLPLQQGPPPAVETVQLLLNDKGRVNVTEKLGSGVGKVEGTVTAQDATSYTVAVTEVIQQNGSTSKWNGELVTIAKEGTEGYQIHRYNKTRTLVLAVAITAGVVVFFLTTKLFGGGSDPNAPPGGGGLQTQLVHPGH